jgi:hypothetical protein
MTSPAGASIVINGKEYGTSPNAIKDLIIGDYTIELSKAGYAPISKKITIPDGKSIELMESLILIGCPIKVNSSPFGADLYVDGNLVGKTPYSGNLPYGKHTLRIIKNNVKAEKNINLTPNTKTESNFELKLDMPTYIKNSFENGKSPKAEIPTIKFFQVGLSYPLISNTNGSLIANDLGYTLRVGIVKTIGAYARISTNLSNTNIDYTINNLPNIYYAKSTKTSSYNRFGTVGGLMLNLKPITLFAGAGWGYMNHYTKADLYNYSDESLVNTINLGDKNSYKGIETDAGLLLNLSMLSLRLDLVLFSDKTL